MPYSTLELLPDWMQKLPKEAQVIYQKTFNSAFDYYKDDTTATKVAIAALKKKYSKNDSGEWVAKEDVRLIEWKEWPVKYKHLNTEKDMEQMRDDLRLLSALATRLNNGQKIHTSGHEMTLDEAIESASNVLRSLLDAEAIKLKPQTWKPSVRQFLGKVVDKVKASGYKINLDESFEDILDFMSPEILSEVLRIDIKRKVLMCKTVEELKEVFIENNLCSEIVFDFTNPSYSSITWEGLYLISGESCV